MKTESQYKTETDAYKIIDLETAAMNASPRQRITMLFDGAISAVRRARIFMQQGKMEEKGSDIAQATAIISRLNYRLDLEKGGQYAEDLSTIYKHLLLRLTEGNRHNDIAMLTESLEILQDVANSWQRYSDILEEANTEQDALNGAS
jgi:flagellar protein FliS